MYNWLGISTLILPYIVAKLLEIYVCAVPVNQNAWTIMNILSNYM